MCLLGQEWKENAAILDDYLRFQDWKKVDDDPYFDWRLVRKASYSSFDWVSRSRQLIFLKVNRSLKILREKNDARGVLGVLETCVRTNFAGVESPR